MKYDFCPQCTKPLQTKVLNGYERKVCPDKSCGFIHWGNPITVLAAIVEQGDSVILVQSIGWPLHFYGLVTGFLEREERPEDGILREVKEEIGLEGELIRFIGIYPFYRNNQLILAYHVRVPEGEVRLDTSELSTYKIVPITKVAPWDRGTGLALQDWLRDTHGIEREAFTLNPRKA